MTREIRKIRLVRNLFAYYFPRARVIILSCGFQVAFFGEKKGSAPSPSHDRLLCVRSAVSASPLIANSLDVVQTHPIWRIRRLMLAASSWPRLITSVLFGTLIVLAKEVRGIDMYYLSCNFDNLNLLANLEK